MPISNVVKIIGFGFGAALSVILLGLSVQKKQKRYDDYAFGIVLIACTLWLGGNFLSMLLSMLFGSVVLFEAKLLQLSAYLGLALMPSSLIHVHLAILFRQRGGAHARLSKLSLFSILAAYVPTLFFILMAIADIGRMGILFFTPTDTLSLPFSVWIIFSIVFTIALSEKLVKLLENESDRHFHRDISFILGVIALGLILVYIIPAYRLAYIGQYLNLLMLLSPAYPMAVLAYYVYRYNFYRLVIKPGLIYSIIYGMVMAIYLLGIRRLGEYLSQFPEVNAEFIEGILLVALVFIFQPFRTQIQNRLDKIFFKDKYYYQQFLRELTDSISGIVDLQKLLQTLSAALVSALKAKACTLIVFRMNEGEPQIYRTYGNHELPDIHILIDALLATRRFRLRRQMRDHRVVLALRRNNIELAIPIHFQDDLIGLVCLTEKRNGSSYSDEELDVLQTFANQVGLAFENARLVQDRLDLEAKVFQAEKLHSLGQLATTLAHEVKNPLSSIKTIIQVLHEKAVGEEAEDLRIVLHEIDRLNTVLEKLLTFARPTTTEFESIKVPEIVQEVIDLLKHQARKSNIKIDFRVANNLPEIRTKKQLIRDIVFNLVFNAAQAMPEGGRILIELKEMKRLKRSDVEKDDYISPAVKKWIQLRISDTGPGIPKERLNKIFDPFYTTKTVGTGLGLAIVKRNVAELNGHLKVRSKENKGAEFIISLPVVGAKVELQEEYA